MTLRSHHLAATFTRGWETLGHFLAMLRASVRRHLVVSVACGLVGGSAWWLSDFARSSTLSALGQRVLVEAQSTLLPSLTEPKQAHGSPNSGPRNVALGGRSLSFITRQWATCVLLAVGVVWVLLAIFVVRYGQSQLGTSHQRGAWLRDPTAEARARWRLRLLVVWCLAMAASIVVTLRPDGFRWLGPYMRATAIDERWPGAWWVRDTHWPNFVWIDGESAAFARADQVVERLRTEVFATDLKGIVFTVIRNGIAFGTIGTAALIFTTRLLDRRSDRAYRVAGIQLAPGKECYHFLFTGSPGSGKSTAIKDLLAQVRRKGAPAIVYDLSGEYVELFYRDGVDCLLNPFDARTAHWWPWADAQTPTEYLAIAKSLFPPEGREPFWSAASTLLFASVLEQLDRASQRSNAQLLQRLTQTSLRDLHATLRGTAAARLLDDKAGAMPANLLATVSSKVAAWHVLQDPVGEPFSIRRFVEQAGRGENRWLFLSTREQDAEILRPLLSLWADIAATALLSLPTHSAHRVWTVLDEVASLQRLPALPAILERGRKHGAAVVLGLQAMPQLREAYGHELAAALMAQPQTWLVLRSVEPTTARWLESALGHTEVAEAHAALQYGAHAERDGVSLSEQQLTKPIVLASEIASLPDFHGFLTLPGSADIYRVRYHRQRSPSIARPFVARR